MGFAIGLVVALGIAAPAALAGSAQVTAGPPATFHDAFATPTVTIAQGQKLTLLNSDSDLHNVTADRSSGGQPIFASKNASQGQTVVVSGTEFLKSGRYTFTCSLHNFMTGTLIVSSAGKPVTKPKSKRKRCARKHRCKSKRG